jgi:hypothetical protein
MQGRQYTSPRKDAPGKTPQFVSRIDKGRRLVKISERKARTPFPPPFETPEEVRAEFEKKKKEAAAKKGITIRSQAPEVSLGGFVDDDGGGFGDDGGGYGDGMSMDEIEYGYGGDDEESGDEEYDSIENMRLDRLEERVKSSSRMERFNEIARQFAAARKRTYKDKLMRFKGNWKEFVDCVTGDLAWSLSVAPPSGVQPCDCKKSITLPAVSWSGTTFL